MGKRSLRLKVATVTFILLAGAGDLPAQSAEIEVTLTRHARQTLSEIKSNPGFSGSGELSQQVFLDSAIDSPADFSVLESRVYNQDDTVGESGRHRGYEVTTLKNGEKVYSKFEGTHKITTKNGGAWEVNFEGMQSIIGGTGMYQNIKGEGLYKGRITADSFLEEDKWRVRY